MKKSIVLRFVSAVLALTVMLTALALPSSAAAYGDIDGDGDVTSADARLALRRAVSLETFEKGSKKWVAADVDFNNDVTSADARLILRAAVGLDGFEEKAVYRIGDTWIVSGEWAFSITGVKLVTERVSYSGKDPAAVYLVEYMYKNLGYIDSFGMLDGLVMYIDTSVTDCKGARGYSYPGTGYYNPTETPIGATCKAQALIGVDNAGPIDIVVSEYGSGKTLHKAKFHVDVLAGSDASGIKPTKISKAATDHAVGDTWTVPGQWNFRINSVKAVTERNPYSSLAPEAVYMIDYTYENIGYVGKPGYMEGLFFTIDELIVDNSGMMGYPYSATVTKYAREISVNESCNAQACIGVDHAGAFKVTLIKHDGNGTERSATFYVNVG